jgi:Protein of unknown function (DUF2934)
MAQMATKSAPRSTRVPASTAAASRPGPLSGDAVAALAFQKWQQRGCRIGDDRRDWFEAEKELAATSISQR